MLAVGVERGFDVRVDRFVQRDGDLDQPGRSGAVVFLPVGSVGRRHDGTAFRQVVEFYRDHGPSR